MRLTEVLLSKVEKLKRRKMLEFEFRLRKELMLKVYNIFYCLFIMVCSRERLGICVSYGYRSTIDNPRGKYRKRLSRKKKKEDIAKNYEKKEIKNYKQKIIATLITKRKNI